MLLRYKKEDCPYTQMEAHQIFEKWNMDLSDSYVFIGRTLFLTAWYASVAPLGVVFSLLGLLMNYWVDKIQLLRYQSKPPELTDQIFTRVLSILEILPLVYMCGAIEYQMKITVSKNLFMFIYDFIGYGATSISLFFMVLAYLIFFRQQRPKPPDSEEKYSDIEHLFEVDYEQKNPITQYQAIKQQSLKKQQIQKSGSDKSSSSVDKNRSDYQNMQMQFYSRNNKQPSNYNLHNNQENGIELMRRDSSAIKIDRLYVQANMNPDEEDVCYDTIIGW